MRFLSKNDNRTEQIDKGLKNRWRWAWLNEKDNPGWEWRVKVDVSGCYHLANEVAKGYSNATVCSSVTSL